MSLFPFLSCQKGSLRRRHVRLQHRLEKGCFRQHSKYICSTWNTPSAARLHQMNVFHTSWLMEVLVIIILQLALVTHYWTWMSHFATWGSILLFFVSTITFNSDTWLVWSSSVVMCKLGRDVYSCWCLVVDIALIYSGVDMFVINLHSWGSIWIRMSMQWVIIMRFNVSQCRKRKKKP